MAKKMLIDATHAEETRVVVVDGTKVEEFDFESLAKRQLTGNIYLAKVTRVEPSLQAAFVEYGGNRHGFLAFSEIHPDYYQIPKEDRDALLAEEAEFVRASEEENGKTEKTKSRTRSRRRTAAEKTGAASAEDAVVVGEVAAGEVPALEGAGTGAAEASGTEEAGASAGEESAAAEPRAGSAAEGEAGDAAASTGAGAAATGAEADDAVAQADEAVADEGEAVTDEGTEGDNVPEADSASDDTAGNGNGNGLDDPDAENGEDGTPKPGYEQVGGDDLEEERQPRRGRPTRRYKIQEVIKVRQILLVQVVKEERGNKGAALTTYLSLAGRYCVLMPNTARGGGISRKITNAADRKKLKEIAASLPVPEGAGLIIRTAGANRTRTEIRRDYEFLTRQWEQIRETTLKSIAPCLIYEEGSLIKRAIRDLYSRDIEEVLVDGERGYREAKDYMKMLMPSHAKNVKHYNEVLPLFSRYQVEGYLAAMFNPVVQLKSGGYIVIDVTEALVAIDVNSGRATREASIEETALKTNLEAAEEAARQMRLRDLAGLIVIDFIDMDERKNNAAVEKRLKEKLKSDRARIQVGRISPFGLLEMSRQRLRPGMIEATTKACPHCHGTGRMRSDDSMALALLRELEEEGVRQRSKEVLIVAPVEIANYLLNQKREHVIRIESRFGLSVRIEGDPSLISPDYRIERFKTASRIISVPEPRTPVIAMPEPEEEPEAPADDSAEHAAESAGDGSGEGRSKRRRRRRRRGRGEGDAHADAVQNGTDGNGAEAGTTEPAEADEATEAAAASGEALPEAAPQEEVVANGRERSRSRRRSRASAATAEAADQAAPEAAEPAEAAEEARPAAAATPFHEVIGEGAPAPDIVEVPEAEAPQRPRRRERVRKPAAAVLAGVPGVGGGAAATAEAAAAPASGPASAASEPAPIPEAALTPEGAPTSGPAPAEVAAEAPAPDPVASAEAPQPETAQPEEAAEAPAPESVQSALTVEASTDASSEAPSEEAAGTAAEDAEAEVAEAAPVAEDGSPVTDSGHDEAVATEEAAPEAEQSEPAAAASAEPEAEPAGEESLPGGQPESGEAEAAAAQ
ncbi:MAG TPA: Rne/Rng family ribonuclease, partial [Paracoccaceae bacterium]|nr:Rne/Rng family ribonuclease [Paracoccaceae bacterium]